MNKKTEIDSLAASIRDSVIKSLKKGTVFKWRAGLYNVHISTTDQILFNMSATKIINDNEKALSEDPAFIDQYLSDNNFDKLLIGLATFIYTISLKD